MNLRPSPKPTSRTSQHRSVALLLAVSAFPVLADPLPLANPGFESNSLADGADFKGSSNGSPDPLDWVRVVPSGCVVGVIGESRGSVPDSPDGLAWLHLQTNQNVANPPRVGQRLGALSAPVFADPAKPNLWVHFRAGRRLNENTAVHVTASLFAVPAGAANWSGGTMVGSAVFSANLGNLTDGDPGSTAQAGLAIPLDPGAAQTAHPGGDYWLVLANTLGGNATPSPQIVIDRVTAQTGDATNPGPQDPPPPPIESADHVAHDLILLNDNGGWCWYQDERVITDRDNGDFVMASVGNYLGYGGEPRDGDIDITTFRPATGKRTRATVSNIPTLGKGDDHNVPALWQRPDGRYFTKYTGHLHGNGSSFGGDIPRSFHRISTLANDGSGWEPEQAFTWPENDVTSPVNGDVTYTNLFFLSSEGAGQGRLYNIARAADRTPNIAYSDNQGATWTYGGKLSTAVTSGGGNYSNGYFVFAGNGVDRIDFMATEHHPRDFNNSIYHGYIKNGRSHDSLGNVIDSNIFDETAPAPGAFTRVWATSPVTSSSYHHGWTMEVEVSPDGTIHGLFTTRYGTAQSTERVGDADHRLFYARFSGGTWITRELCKMGNSLDGFEGDYTGLGSIHPDDPSTLYISAEHDPRDATPLPKHEIFKGVTSDQGATWTWTPITWNSTVENLRPVVPKWRQGSTALFWLRGRYPFQRDYDQSVVGVILDRELKSGSVTYHDATPANTTLTDGTALSSTGPAASDGAADGRWHRHTGFGNGATAWTVNESGSENAPGIKTSVAGLADGTYDVFAYFWSKPGDDWRLRAGFSASDLLAFRRSSCQQAEAAQFTGPVTVLDPSRALYRAYVGRRTVTGGSAIDVHIDDFEGAAAAGSQRSAYDGIGVARVLPVLHVGAGETRSLAAGDGPYDSIHNEGTLFVSTGSHNITADFINSGLLFLQGDAVVQVGGIFNNSGVIDLIHWTGTLPAGLANTGTIIERGSLQIESINRVANHVEISLQSHQHHLYQLQFSPDLHAGSWEDIGGAVAGNGTGGAGSPLLLIHSGVPANRPRGFYRVRVDPASP